jgi:hypothetical protein
MALNNSNTAGVFGSGGAPWGLVEGEDDPDNVLTGIEFSIPLSSIGSPGSGTSVRILAFVGNGAFQHMSNQVSGEGILDENIADLFYGTDPLASFNDYPGDQFVSLTVPGAEGGGALGSSAVPEPGALAMAVSGLFGAGLAIGRRRSQLMRSMP